MSNPSSSKSIEADLLRLLPQMGLLFNSPRGGTLPNGNTDLGFNCCAKAFVVMYLSRLRGLAVDICGGEALVVEKSPGQFYSYRINPHYWVGSPASGVIDLSMRDFQGRKFLPIVKGTVFDEKSWTVSTTANCIEYQNFGAKCRRMPDGAKVLYWMNEIRIFRFEEIMIGGMARTSESTRRLAARYPGNNVVAKAILHLHRMSQGTRLPLVAETQTKAWDELARWQVDAVGDLRGMLNEAGMSQASAGWEQETNLRLESSPEWELPAPPCILAS